LPWTVRDKSRKHSVVSVISLFKFADLVWEMSPHGVNAIRDRIHASADHMNLVRSGIVTSRSQLVTSFHIV